MKKLFNKHPAWNKAENKHPPSRPKNSISSQGTYESNIVFNKCLMWYLYTCSLYCEECQEEYSAEKVEYRYRISVLASDRTQLAQITVFGSCLDKFFGLSATSFARFDSLIRLI